MQRICILISLLIAPAWARLSRRGAPTADLKASFAPQSFLASEKANASEADIQQFLGEQKHGASLAAKVSPGALLAPSVSQNVFSMAAGKAGNTTKVGNVTKDQNKLSFMGWYNSHASGRGIWKWSNALEAYDRHFSGLNGYQANMAEVGVQSGGSILMWEAVLGSKCHVYGLDINPACTKFSDSQTTIAIGDQADPAMWKHVFGNVFKEGELDILVDDGGHESHQMLTTLAEVFYRLQPGGVIALEDIHGQHYVPSFFTPAANYLAYMAEKGDVESIHVYPYLLVVQKSGKNPRYPMQSIQMSADAPVVSGFAELWEAMPKNYGGQVVLANKEWGPFMTAQGLTNFFAHFADLHAYDYYATPTGCEHTAQAVCTNTIRNSATQTLIKGIHIYKDKVVAEVNPVPPVIKAERKGTEWITYSM